MADREARKKQDVLSASSPATCGHVRINSGPTHLGIPRWNNPDYRLYLMDGARVSGWWICLLRIHYHCISYPWGWKFNKYWRDSTVFSLLALNSEASEQVGVWTTPHSPSHTLDAKKLLPCEWESGDPKPGMGRMKLMPMERSRKPQTTCKFRYLQDIKAVAPWWRICLTCTDPWVQFLALQKEKVKISQSQTNSHLSGNQ